MTYRHPASSGRTEQDIPTGGEAAALTSALLSRRSFARGLAGAAAGLVLAPMALRSLALASEATEAALADAQSRYEAAQGQLSILQDQAFDAQAAYDQTSTDLYNTNVQIDELQVSINEKQAELAQAQDVLADRVNASYRAGSTGMLDVILSATNFDDFVNRVFYAGKTSDADAQAIQNVKDIKASLQADQDALQEQKAQQEELQAQQAVELETLNAQVAETESYVASLDSEVQGLIAQRNAEIQAAAEAARRAAEEEAARQAAAQQQAAANQGGGDAGTGDAGTTGGADADTGDAGGGSDYDDGGYDDGGYDDSGSSSGGGSGYQPAGVVSAAYNYIGTPYSVMDCSGLTSQAYADCGYYLYHQSGVQYNTVAGAGGIVGADSLVPGNLVFYARGGSIYHVALYIGDGYVIDSIPNGGVQVRSMYFVDGFCGGGSPF